MTGWRLRDPTARTCTGEELYSILKNHPFSIFLSDLYNVLHDYTIIASFSADASSMLKLREKDFLVSNQVKLVNYKQANIELF